jgi:protein SCO1/2
MRQNLSILLVAMAALWSGCSRGAVDPRNEYELRGTVVEVDREHRTVTVAHEEIPGYMAAMTMPFQVRDDWAFTALKPGRQIAATLVVQGGRSWLENLSVSEGAGDAGAVTVAKAPAGAIGSEIPDFTLSNQDGRLIRMSQFRGSALLVTFIYTRCPLPDYCPLMTNHFLSLYRSLVKEEPLLARTHLLTVSFDPAFDTPAVLREYAERYLRGEATDAFNRWDFATGTAEEIRKMAGYFGLEYWSEGGQIVHSLRTAVISPDGKLVRLYSGNDWTPGDLLREVRSLP